MVAGEAPAPFADLRRPAIGTDTRLTCIGLVMDCSGAEKDMPVPLKGLLMTLAATGRKKDGPVLVHLRATASNKE